MRMKTLEKTIIFFIYALVVGVFSFNLGRFYSSEDNPVTRIVKGEVLKNTPVKIDLDRVDTVIKNNGKKYDNEYKIYRVKKGDSIYSISKKFVVLEWQVRRANNFKKSTVLHPGQKIKIPIINWGSKSYVGNASWYGPGFHGKRMANGQRYDQNAILVAHRTLPLGIQVRITNLKNGKSIIVKVLDRGPYAKRNGRYTREIDLSKGAAKLLGMIKSGVVPVRIEPI
jgi:rare lipoprotein A (peptidoglycan hydrolase)